MKAIEYEHYVAEQKGEMKGIWPFRKALFDVRVKIPSESLLNHFDLKQLGTVEARNEKSAINKAMGIAIKSGKLRAGIGAS